VHSYGVCVFLTYVPVYVGESVRIHAYVSACVGEGARVHVCVRVRVHVPFILKSSQCFYLHTHI